MADISVEFYCASGLPNSGFCFWEDFSVEIVADSN